RDHGDRCTGPDSAEEAAAPTGTGKVRQECGLGDGPPDPGDAGVAGPGPDPDAAHDHGPGHDCLTDQGHSATRGYVPGL
ncbi:hypothetical protein CPC16_002462, partial [Podila verticillata]